MHHDKLYHPLLQKEAHKTVIQYNYALYDDQIIVLMNELINPSQINKVNHGRIMSCIHVLYPFMN